MEKDIRPDIIVSGARTKPERLVVMDGQHLPELPQKGYIYRAESLRMPNKNVDIDHPDHLTHSVEFV
jgi:hypothetical protein